MVLTEIKQILKTLTRLEKFQLVQFLVMELAQEEQELTHYFKPESRHGSWSQYNTFEAAQALQLLLQGNKR